MTLLVLSCTALIVFVLADMFFAATWWPPYFRSGLLVYRNSMAFASPRSHGPRFMPTASELEGEFDGLFTGLITFQQLGENEIAMRKRFRFFNWVNYTSMLHGRLRLDPKADRVIVEAWANWAPVAAALLAGAVAAEENLGGLRFFCLALGFVAGMSLIDLFAYRRITRSVAERMFVGNTADKVPASPLGVPPQD